jgi:hypothetical protein
MWTYTRTPVTIADVKVPMIANVMIAPKFEKNGFYIEDRTIYNYN